MAERLGQALDVGYRPLNPADDVAGLAGQRQALGEFEAASADAARQAAAQQAQVDSSLRAHETFARLAQQAQKIELDRRQAMHTMEMQREDLLLEQRLMPGRLDAMALQNEAQFIDNAYAEQEEIAELESMRIQNDIGRANLRQAALEAEEVASIQLEADEYNRHIEAGGDPASFKWKYRTTRAGQAAQLTAERRGKETNRAQQTELIQENQNQQIADLQPKQRNSLQDEKFYTGDAMNDLGEDVLRRMTIQNKLLPPEVDHSAELRAAGLTPALPGLPISELGEMVGGNMVLTQKGIQHFGGLRGSGAPTGYPTGTSTRVDRATGLGVTTTTRKDYTVVVNERHQELIDKSQRPPTLEERGKLFEQAIRQTAAKYETESKAVKDLANGIPVYQDINGELKITYPEERRGTAAPVPAAPSAGSEGIDFSTGLPKVTSTKEAAGAGRTDLAWRTHQETQRGPTGATGNYRDTMQQTARNRTDVAAAYGKDISPERVPGIEDHRQNTPYPGPTDSEGETTTSWGPDQWNESILPVKGDVFSQLTGAPATKNLDGSHIPLSVQGRGLPDALAEEVISRNIEAKASNRGDVEAALETAFGSVVEELDGKRGALAVSMDFPDWWGHGSNREADEINSQLIIESKQIKDVLRKYTSKEIVDRNTDDDKKNDIILKIPIQLEAETWGGTPDEKGHLNFSRHRTKQTPGAKYLPGTFGHEIHNHKFTNVTQLEQFRQAIEELKPLVYLSMDINHYLQDPVPIKKPYARGYTDSWKPFTRK